MEKPRNISGQVSELLTPVIKGMGYSVWDVEYVKEGANMYLRVTIDKNGIIDINDCEKVHRAINTVLDEKDPISDAYILEVSSPGVERTLRLREHYEYAKGSKALIKLFAPDTEGKKEYIGIIENIDDDCVTLQSEGKEIRIALSSVAKANTVYDF